MNAVQIFEKSEFGRVRIQMDVNNEPLFCLADVCKAVGLQNPSSVKQRLDAEDVQLVDLHALKYTEGANIVGNTMSNFVTEAGFYDVLLQSNSTKVKPFRKWVTSEVLPSIRKHGAYATETTIESIIANPERGIKLLQALQQEREEKKRLEAENAAKQERIELQEQTINVRTEENKVLKASIEKQAPFVEYVSTTLQSPKTYTSTQMAKELGMRTANELHNRLRDMGIMYKQSGQWMLTSKYCGKGYTKPRTTSGMDEYGKAWSNTITVWTETGRMFLHENFDNKDAKDAEAARVLQVQHGSNAMTGETPAAVQ